MLYIHPNDRNAVNDNNESDHCDESTSQLQWILLSDNKPFLLTDEEFGFIKNNLGMWDNQTTLNPYIVNKKYLTKIIRNERYHLRNRKKLKGKSRMCHTEGNKYQKNKEGGKKHYSSSSNQSVISGSASSSLLTKQKRHRETKSHKKKYNNNNDEKSYDAVNGDDDDSNKRRSHKKKLSKTDIPKDKYAKRLDRMMAKLGDDNNNNGNPSADEYVTTDQISLFFGEMIKVLNKKQDKKQRRPLKEIKEEKQQEKLKIISSFKQRIYQLTLNQIKELNNEFFKAENDKDNDYSNINLDFKKLDDDQIQKFSLKLEMYEKLNLLNKDNHKTFKDELAQMRLNNKNQDLIGIKQKIKISGKDIPFIDDDDEEEDDSSSDLSDLNEGKDKEMKKDSDMSLDNDSDEMIENMQEIRGNGENIEKSTCVMMNHKKIIEDDNNDISEDSDENGSI